MIVGITGHRPDKLGGWRTPNKVQTQVRAALTDVLAELRPALLVSGMALGVDQWAAEACIALGIPFRAAVPFQGQESMWPPLAQERYRSLLKQAVDVIVVCEGEYKPWKLQRRNEWVVDHIDLLVAVWDGSRGGTGNCVGYAASIERPVRRVAWQDYVIN